MPQITWGVIEVSRVLSILSLTHLLSSQANTFLLNTFKTHKLIRVQLSFLNIHLNLLIFI